MIYYAIIDFEKIDKYLIKYRYYIIIILFIIACLLSIIIELLTMFCTQKTTNIDLDIIALIFYIPLIVIFIIIVGLYYVIIKYFYYSNEDRSTMNNNTKSIILSALWYPIIMIICFLPGMIVKLYKVANNHNDAPFIGALFHVIFQNIYGALISTVCLFNIYKSQHRSKQVAYDQQNGEDSITGATAEINIQKIQNIHQDDTKNSN